MLMMMLMMVDDDVNNYDVDDYHYNDFLRQEPHLGCFQITRLAWHSLLGFHLKVQIGHHQKSEIIGHHYNYDGENGDNYIILAFSLVKKCGI